jgi:hypothetical protein
MRIRGLRESAIEAKGQGGKHEVPVLPHRWYHAVLRLAVLGFAGLLAGCLGTPSPAPQPVTPGAVCLADLKTQGAFFDIAPEPTAAKACVIDTPVVASGLAAALATPATMSCALADRLLHFDQEALQPLAQQMFGQKIVLLRHYGAFSCRAEASTRKGHWSQHAFGRAIDIAGFTLSDGTRIDIEKDWTHAGAHGRFLHAIAKRACSYFSVVLTPASNSLHRNHFHFDIGPDQRCDAS